jgi:hypothetical protein
MIYIHYEVFIGVQLKIYNNVKQLISTTCWKQIVPIIGRPLPQVPLEMIKEQIRSLTRKT